MIFNIIIEENSPITSKYKKYLKNLEIVCSNNLDIKSFSLLIIFLIFLAYYKK